MTRQLTINKTSWVTFRDVLREQESFRTYGNLRGEPDTFDVGQLPDPWRTEYHTRRGLITYTVLSYSTPIAWYDKERGWVYPDVKYSITTSKAQGRIGAAIHALIEEAASVPEKEGN